MDRTTPALSRRTLLTMLGAAGGTAALAACAPSAPSNDNTATSPATADTSAPAEDFSFASWSLSEEAAKPTFEQLIGDFESSAGVSITTATYPYAEYLNQLTLQIRGGQFAGAMQVDIAWLATLAALGKLVDLSSLAEGRGYSDAGLAAGQVSGTQYGLPWTLGAIGLIANSDMLGQVGADALPETIDDFTDLLRELKGLGDDVIPYAASTKVDQMKDVQVWMMTFGCPLVTDGKVVIGDDASVEAVTWYKSLYDDGLIAADVDRFAARSLFSQGRAVMYDDAPVARSSVVTDSPIENLADLLLPCARPVKAAGDTPQAQAWGHAIAVADGDGSATAAQFAQWLTSDPAALVPYFQQLGLPPSVANDEVDAEVAKDTFIADFTERITATAAPSPFWAYPSYGQIDAAINEKVQAAITGQQDVAAALADAAAAAQELIG